METGIPKSARRPAPASGDEVARIACYRQSQRGERSASRLPTRIPTATAAIENARPSGTVASSRVCSGTTPNRNQRPLSTATTRSHRRYSAASYESTTLNSSCFTAGAGASPARPTSTASQPENGGSSYFVWARRQERLAALQSPMRGHDYAAAGIVRSYHRVPSALRSEEDAISSQSPISSVTGSDNASASVRWGEPAGALRHTTHAVAPSLHSQAGRIGAASIITKREDSVAPISRYNRNTRPRNSSTPVLPLLPAAGEQRPRTFLDMHDQYERTPTYRPKTQQVDWGSNLSPHSPGYTLEKIRQRRAAVSRGFPQPHVSAMERRIFAGSFVDAPTRFNATRSAERIATRDVVKVEAEVKLEEEEEPKTPGKWRKMSGLFTKKLARKGKGASPTQVSPTASPSTSHSTPSRVDGPPGPMATSSMPTAPATPPFAMRTREERSPSPLVVPPFRLRPALMLITSPVSSLSEADAHQGTGGLSPVSPLSERSSLSNGRRTTSSHRSLATLTNPTKAKQELISCLKAASALPQHHGPAPSSHSQSAKSAEDAEKEHILDTLTSEQHSQALFPSPLVVQKRLRRSHSPLLPVQIHGHGRRHQPAAQLVGDNAHWGNARSVRVVAKGKGRLVASRENSQQLPERSRPALSEAPGSASKAGVESDVGDGKERRDTTFAGVGTDGKGEREDQDEDNKSIAPSWRTNDSQKFSHRITMGSPRT